MRHTFRYLAVMWLIIFLASCASTVTTSTSGTTSGGKYSEDLSVLRPKTVPTDTAKQSGTASTNTTDRKATTYVEPKFAVNDKLDTVLDSIARINHTNGYIDGFTIQIYSGVRREDALNAKKELSISLPQLSSEVQYVQPNFRVRAGKYFDRITAQKDYLEVKRHFPNAIVIPDRIPISQ
jgi:hypothetical protein